MKRFVTTIMFALTAIVFMGGQLRAQFVTTFAKNATPGQQNGIYYSLPQTMLRLDFVIDEIQMEKGPLSEYASTYMDMADIVEYETTEYKLVDVKLTSVASPDPNALFFVSLSTGRGGNKIQFDVMPNGIIRSVGIGAAAEQEKPVARTEKPVCCNEKTEPNYGFISLLSAGKSNAQLAKEVAEKIEEIRKEKFYLVRGDVAMAYDPVTFNTMYQRLDEMEKEYTSLLTGKRVAKRMVKQVYVIPNKEVTTQTVAKFSESDGLTVGTSGTGSAITVQTLSLNTTEAINAPSQSAVESMSYENKLFYRIPETAQVKVACGKKTILEDRVTVSQLGSLLMAPLTNTNLVFDIETGQIVNLQMQ